MRTFPPEVEQALVTGQDTYVWETPSFRKYERGSAWYLALTLVAVFLIAYAVWTANFLFAFIIFLSSILLLLVGNQEPKNVLVQVGNNGVVWDGKLYLYQDLENFSIIYQPPQSKVLYIEPKSSVTPRLSIDLQEQDPVGLREFLRQYVREDLDLQGEHFSDIIGRLLRI